MTALFGSDEFPGSADSGCEMTKGSDLLVAFSGGNFDSRNIASCVTSANSDDFT
jgi:hypothetical protein